MWNFWYNRFQLLFFSFYQSIQDELLSEEIEKCRASNSRFFPPPLQRLQDLLKASDLEDTAETKDLKNVIVKSCMRDMYQYARVSGVHVMETVVEAALSAIKKEQFEDASNVCVFGIFQC